MDIKDLAGVSEPAAKLIDRCSDALGAMAHPIQIVRVAKAEAKAAEIKAYGEIEVAKIRAVGAVEVSEVEERALARMLREEGKNQRNIEFIFQNALPDLKPEAKPDDIEEDWLSNFFDKCRLISDEEMRALWSKVLAGEANKPGTYSKRTINFMQSLSNEEAKDFQSLCRFSIGGNNLKPIIYSPEDKVYGTNGVSFIKLNNLQGLGLISFNNTNGFVRIFDTDSLLCNYFSKSFIVEIPTSASQRFDSGKVILTKLGEELANVCVATPVNEFPNYLAQKWTEMGYKVKEIG